MSSQPFLTQEQAQKRYDLFDTNSDLHYNIVLQTSKGSPTYRGLVTITFTLKSFNEDDFFLEFASKGIEKITINGKELSSQSNYTELMKENHIHFPKDFLKVGTNTLSVLFTQEYSKKKKGIHCFTDTDGTSYIYSISEPYYTNTIMPCFDQPDLKARFELHLLADETWTTVFNEPLSNKTKSLPNEWASIFTLKEGEQLYSFKSTPKLSTYLFVVIAGDYKEITWTQKHRDIEFRVYCRASMYKYVSLQAEEIFDVTKKGFEFYEDLFGTKYPFAKYDQIFCPEYGTGAMETPSAVTINDLYAFKDPPTSTFRYWVAHVIVHELAHHWFGDLVTMKWWNDLWLNESFADAMAYICMENIKPNIPTENPWILCFKSKAMTYRQDEKPTTHPVSAEVKNTEMAALVFDGITYTKGAASLVQLFRLLGREAWSKAMTSYFSKFAWKNATLDDFISNLQEFLPEVEKGSAHDLEVWKKDWLFTAGLSEIKVHWDPSNRDKKAKLVVRQTPCLVEFPSNRFIKVKVALFDKHGATLQVIDTILNKDATEIEYDGSLEPAIVFPNYGDEGYIKVKLDDISLKNITSCLHMIIDPITRSIMWACLFEEVRAGDVTSLDYIEAALSGLELEGSDVVFGNLFENMQTAISAYTPRKLRDLIYYKIFSKIYKLLQTTDKKETNRLMILVHNLIVFGHNEDHLLVLRDFLAGTEPNLKDQKLKLVNKWSIVKKLFSSKKLSSKEKYEILEKMQQEDPSDKARSTKIYADAVLVNKEQREALWNSFLDENNKETYSNIKEQMDGFNDPFGEEDLKKYFDLYWERIFDVYDKRDHDYATNFYGHLMPFDDDLEVHIKKIEGLLEKTPKNSEYWKKSLGDSLDNLKRRLRSYNLLKKTLLNPKL